MKTSELILESYYLAKILDPQEQSEGYYLTDGLRVLNESLVQWSSLGIYIPAIKTLPVNLTANNYLYAVSPQIIEILQANIVDASNVKYPLIIADEKLQNSFNYDIIKTRPSYVYMRQNQDLIDEETGLPSTNLYFYPTPNTTFTANLTIKRIMLEFGLNDDLTTIPSYYIKPLKFQLAIDLGLIYGTSAKFDARFDKEYDRLMTQLKAANRQDMSVLGVNPFLGYRLFRPWGIYVG